MNRGFEKMKMVKLLGVALFLGLFVIQPKSFAQDAPKPGEIIAKSRLAFYYAADDMKARISMELTDKDGRKRIRELTMLRKDAQDGGEPSFAKA